MPGRKGITSSDKAAQARGKGTGCAACPDVLCNWYCPASSYVTHVQQQPCFQCWLRMAPTRWSAGEVLVVALEALALICSQLILAASITSLCCVQVSTHSCRPGTQRCNSGSNAVLDRGVSYKP
jgi:hypothetical protein